MSQHFELVCQHGYKHGQCRCPSKDKTVRRMVCNIPEHAQNSNLVPNNEADKLGELYDAINGFAKAVGEIQLDPNLNTHEEYVLLAHNSAVKAAQDRDAAQAALWPKGRGC